MSAARPPVRTSPPTLVFVGGLLLVAADAPLWCVAVAAGRCRLAPRAREPAGAANRSRGAACVSCSARSPRYSLLAVLMSFRTLNGLAAGTALLVLMGALKLIEARSRRDDGIVVGVALFLLLAAVLADQSMWRVPLYL